jgi:hypothetical protein
VAYADCYFGQCPLPSRQAFPTSIPSEPDDQTSSRASHRRLTQSRKLKTAQPWLRIEGLENLWPEHESHCTPSTPDSTSTQNLLYFASPLVGSCRNRIQRQKSLQSLIMTPKSTNLPADIGQLRLLVQRGSRVIDYHQTGKAPLSVSACTNVQYGTSRYLLPPHLFCKAVDSRITSEVCRTIICKDKIPFNRHLLFPAILHPNKVWNIKLLSLPSWSLVDRMCTKLSFTSESSTSEKKRPSIALCQLRLLQKLSVNVHDFVLRVPLKQVGAERFKAQ